MGLSTWGALVRGDGGGLGLTNLLILTTIRKRSCLLEMTILGVSIYDRIKKSTLQTFHNQGSAYSNFGHSMFLLFCIFFMRQ